VLWTETFTVPLGATTTQLQAVVVARGQAVRPRSPPSPPRRSRSRTRPSSRSRSGYRLDKQQNGTLDSNRHVAIYSAQAPSGLAGSTNIQVTPSGTVNNKGMALAYTTGIATSSPVDGTASGGTGTTTAWSTGSISTANADDLIWTAGHRDALVTNTASGGTTELDDFQNSTDSITLTDGYQIVAATGSYAGTGTWNTGTTAEWCAAAVAYKGAGGGGGVTVVKNLAALGVG
jgi:hypothetical protein